MLIQREAAAAGSGSPDITRARRLYESSAESASARSGRSVRNSKTETEDGEEKQMVRPSETRTFLSIIRVIVVSGHCRAFKSLFFPFHLLSGFLFSRKKKHLPRGALLTKTSNRRRRRRKERTRPCFFRGDFKLSLRHPPRFFVSPSTC